MFPMDYEEFRWALGDTASIPLLRKFYDKQIPLGQAFRKSMRDFRLYMLVGGMPQAVNEYLDTNNLSKVDAVKREIIELYFDDFLKIDPTGRASQLFRAIPSELSKNAARYQVASVLSDKLSANLGYVYENIVAQMLTFTGNELFYHTWPVGNSNHNYEVDFLLSRGSKICPIEVKSSGYNSHASLDAFCQKYSARVGNRYLIYTKDFIKDEATTLLPVFFTCFL